MFRNIYPIAGATTTAVIAGLTYSLTRALPRGPVILWNADLSIIIVCSAFLIFITTLRLVVWLNRREIYTKHRVELEAEVRRIVRQIFDSAAKGEPCSLTQFST